MKLNDCQMDSVNLMPFTTITLWFVHSWPFVLVLSIMRIVKFNVILYEHQTDHNADSYKEKILNLVPYGSIYYA